MSKSLEQIWKEANETGFVDIGDAVFCDWCSEDYTNSDAQGGFMFDSHATCPACAGRMMPSIIKFNEEDHIRDVAEPGETFRDFTLRMRGGDNSIRVYNQEPGETHDAFMERVKGVPSDGND